MPTLMSPPLDWRRLQIGVWYTGAEAANAMGCNTAYLRSRYLYNSDGRKEPPDYILIAPHPTRPVTWGILRTK